MIIFEHLTPYHYARLQALGQTEKVLAVEIHSREVSFPHQKKDSFKKISIIKNAQLEKSGDAFIFEKIIKTIKDFNPSVIALPGWVDPWALFTLNWANTLGIPTVVMSDSQRLDFQRYGPTEWIKRQVLKGFNAGFAAGQSHKKYLTELGLPRESIFIGCDVVDNTHFKNNAEKIQANADKYRKQLNLPKNYYLSSFRFIKKKNPIFLLKAYEKYYKSSPDPWNLVILGQGPLKAHLVEYLKSAGLENQILLPGFIPYYQLPAYYALASAFILSSLSEQWGLVVNEAMASKLPILVSNRCGCAEELVQNGLNGYIFDPYDKPGFVELLQKISNGSVNLKKMGQKSADRIAKWSPEFFAKNLRNACEYAIINHSTSNSILQKALLQSLIYRPSFTYRNSDWV